ncbi:protein HESO1-like [Triticum dicoccoides]|uniref:protein HESO1-like n=1 Tax=Triticum dicoccoides TaxID=85692 RepID=UPI00188DF6F8|nr:protein HESO1-like [Triticum dicoccoides]
MPFRTGFSMIVIVRDFSLVGECIEEVLSVIKPTEDDRNKRLETIQEFVNSIYSAADLGGSSVKPFGSFASNLYAKSGDLDVSVELSNDPDSLTTKKKKQALRVKRINALSEVRRVLQIKGVARDVQFIPTARVPVLSYVSNKFGISCDISIDNYPGRIKSRVLYWLNTLDKRFGDMVLLVKEWAKAQNINDPKNGTLNSYSLFLLVIFYFQTCTPAIFPPMNEFFDVDDPAGETKLACL